MHAHDSNNNNIIWHCILQEKKKPKEVKNCKNFNEDGNKNRNVVMVVVVVELAILGVLWLQSNR